jgi:hypothetical protein
MLQADAALLGFGAIFIIYKIQSLYNRYEHTFALTQTWREPTSPPDFYNKAAVDIITNHTIDGRVKILLKTKYDTVKVKYIELLITIPKKIDEIKTMIKLPIFTIGSHCVLSAICLWFTPIMTNSWKMNLFNPINGLMITLFIIGVGASVRVALNLIIKDEELSLEKYFPEIYKQVYVDIK